MFCGRRSYLRRPRLSQLRRPGREPAARQRA